MLEFTSFSGQLLVSLPSMQGDYFSHTVTLVIEHNRDCAFGLVTNKTLDLDLVELLDSSGHKVLDDAAIRIVLLSAPYAPFPDELRKSTDVLEIIRTWQFKKKSSLRSY